jgi:stearoyl-CoA desaturase (delta-9 desaturase)
MTNGQSLGRPSNGNPVAFLDRVLDPPSYGFVRNGQLYVPTQAELWREFFNRMNIFQSRKNWLPLAGWLVVLFFAPFFFAFFIHYFTWKLFIIGFIYSMVILGTHGTVYLHRYSTHHAFTFSNRFWLFIVRNLVIKIIPEEVYVISHHVHHYRPEKPGDPYNVHAGWLYCFLADVNHQSIARDLSPADYERTAKLVSHAGVKPNSYAQYQKWGSICDPVRTFFSFTLNWAFWFGAFYLLGGMPLVMAIFGMSGVWAVGIRTYNFEGHGRGKDSRKEGSDFNQEDLSINQPWPGMVTGEWHNNHHLYPNSARNGFLPHQLDFAWYFIVFYRAIGAIDTYRDSTQDFFEKHYKPYLAKKRQMSEAPISAAPLESAKHL